MSQSMYTGLLSFYHDILDLYSQPLQNQLRGAII